MSSPMQELETEVASVSEAAGPGQKAITGRSPGQLAWRRMRHDAVTMTALVLVALFALLAIAAPILRTLGVLDPYAPHLNLITGFGSMPTGFGGGISLAHPFGVEPQTGRDVFSRVILGIAFSMMIATCAVLISAVIGMTVGIISGYMGGVTDFWLGRFMDLILSFPQLLMLLALSTVLKQRIASIMGTCPGLPRQVPSI